MPQTHLCSGRRVCVERVWTAFYRFSEEPPAARVGTSDDHSIPGKVPCMSNSNLLTCPAG